MGYRGTQAFVQCAPCGLQASVRQATGAHRHWCSVVLTGRCSGEGEAVVVVAVVVVAVVVVAVVVVAVAVAAAVAVAVAAATMY